MASDLQFEGNGRPAAATEVTEMTHATIDMAAARRYMDFEIREVNGWYVGVPLRPQVWTVLEAENRSVLEYKIRRWWVGLH